MRSIFKKLFYKNLPVVEYVGITVHDTINEKVFLKINDHAIDVSENHWVLCLQPVIFGIWVSQQVNSQGISNNKKFSLFFREMKPPKKLCSISLSFFSVIPEPDGILLLLKVEKCKLYLSSGLEAILLYSLFYHKPGFSFKKFKMYASAFSYPRKVRIVSFQSKDFYNIFPMDLAGSPTFTNYYVFGLRHTSKALHEIMKEKKVVVSEVPFIHKKIVYELGRHHSSAPPPLDQLPFHTFSSKHFCFPIPEWTENYSEIRIVQSMDLGSHMLLWGHSEHQEKLHAPRGNLYHIHFLLSLLKKRAGTGYTEV